MNKKLILQIGRLDSNYLRNIKFVYNSKEYSKPLSSLAFKEDCNDTSNVILVYPVSIAINESLKNSNDSFICNYIKPLLTNNEKLHQYLKNPNEILRQHPHSKEANGFFVIHSLGKYSNIDFKTTMHDIVLFVWSLLIKEYMEHNFQEIYVDISSGLNFYVVSLLEALRYFIVWQQLFDLNTEKVEGFVNYTDPIIGSNADKINIYTYQVSYKTFFSSPLNYTNYNSVSKDVFENALSNRDLKREVNCILEEFLIVFSAFYRPAPLILFVKKFNDLNTIEDKIKQTVDATIEKYQGNWVCSPKFQFSEFSKIFMTLAFMRGLREFMDANNIVNDQEYVTYTDLENVAETLESLNLQNQKGLLKTELINNFRNKNFNNEWRKLEEFLQTYMNDNSSNDISSNDISNDGSCVEIEPRNFFAHAGFERTVTQVKKENDTIYIKYDQNKMDRILNILKKAI